MLLPVSWLHDLSVSLCVVLKETSLTTVARRQTGSMIQRVNREFSVSQVFLINWTLCVNLLIYPQGFLGPEQSLQVSVNTINKMDFPTACTGRGSTCLR